jgi:hypothetical protein
VGLVKKDPSVVDGGLLGWLPKRSTSMTPVVFTP